MPGSITYDIVGIRRSGSQTVLTSHASRFGAERALALLCRDDQFIDVRVMTRPCAPDIALPAPFPSVPTSLRRARRTAKRANDGNPSAEREEHRAPDLARQ